MEDFIATRVSKMKKGAPKEFISVNYVGPKKKMKKNVCLQENMEKGTKEDTYIDRKKKQELEMKRVRYEVMKFGMSGLEKSEANKAKIELIINLGAKPPKNQNINYKELKNTKMREKEMNKKKEHASGLKGSMVKHKTTKTRKKKSDGILEVYGKVNKKTLSKKKS
ncbi:uncharacterized protein C1orf131 homolog [Hylaeus anthracinus]|uniref:uncharacterized protein C1orf131 homolog n=1 Tax=Hylaeus anthracinus TaxID=313031 RepID=UPI0023BA00FF|nr:uncharacterized protein C1orf131 homolog [Hylaeus anthracinus]